MSKKRVGILSGLESEVRRGLVKGIMLYNRTGPQWDLWTIPHTNEEVKSLEKHRLDALVGWWNVDDQPFIDALKLPNLNMGDTGLAPNSPPARQDDREIGRVAGRYFLERNFKSFAFVGRPGKRWSEHRQEGFFDALKSNSDTVHVHKSEDLLTWLKQLPKPLAVFAASDWDARRVADAGVEAGIAIPQDIAVLGVNNDELTCEMKNPTLSSIHIDQESVGYTGARILDEMMQGKPLPDEPVLIHPGEVMPRASTDMFAVDDQVVEEAMRYIHANARRPLKASEVQNALNVSWRTLSRKFRKELGRTLHDEIILARIQRAREALATTDADIASISKRCGFTSVGRFQINFKDITGMTPSEFRRARRPQTTGD